jgi:hypothetical protein
MMRWMEHYLQGPGGAAPAAELDYEELTTGDSSDEYRRKIVFAS